MGNNKANMVTADTLDFYLGVTGFLYPSTEAQLDLFDKLYEDFNYQLDDKNIDCKAIIENRLLPRTIFSIFTDVNEDEVQTLKMAARKGIKDLSDEVINKMYGKHPKKPRDKE